MILQSVVQALAPLFSDIGTVKQAIWKVAEYLEPLPEKKSGSPGCFPC
jgi:hypothetical protein